MISTLPTRRAVLGALATLPLMAGPSGALVATWVAPDLRHSALTLPGRVDIGPAGASATIIEFFDYNCAVCRSASQDVAALLSADRRLRLVLIDIPSLGIPSIEAAKVALAVRDLGDAPRSYAFHRRLFSQRGVIDGARAVAVATELGFSADAVVAAANAPGVGPALSANVRLADRIGVRVTPSYVVGERLVAGAPGAEGLRQLVAAARRG